jgi:hypothetical protein
LSGQEPRRRYLEDQLARKCEKRHFRQKNGNDNHSCAVRTEILGRRRGAGKDLLVPLQKAYEFKADGMNILPCTPIVQMLPLGDIGPIAWSLSRTVEVTVLPSVSYLPISIAPAKRPKVIDLCKTRSPPV